MQGELKVHIEFLDPNRPAQDETMKVDYPPGHAKQACVQLLAQINMTNGIMKFLEEGDEGIFFIPLAQVKTLKITAPAIVTANAADMSLEAARARAANAVAGRVKLTD